MSDTTNKLWVHCAYINCKEINLYYMQVLNFGLCKLNVSIHSKIKNSHGFIKGENVE